MTLQTTTFKGARYLVKFHDPIEWAATESYEAIEAVQHNAYTYISKQPVPAGVQIDNDDFWLLWADPNAQMEELRQLVSSYVDNLETVENVLPVTEFDTTNTVKKYIEDIENEIPSSSFDSTNTVKKYIDDSSFAKLNVSKFGVDLTGETDCADIIQDIIDENPGKTLYFPEGRYQLSKTIKTWAGPVKHTDLIFDPNAEFFTNNNLQCLFFIGGYNPDDKFNTTTYLGHKYYFIGGRFDGTNCEWAVKMSSSSCDTQFMFCNFLNCKNGLLLGDGNTDGGSIDTYVDNCNFRGTGITGSCGIKAMYPDYKINHCRIYGFQTCIYGESGGAYLFDIHTLDLSNPDYGYSNSCVVYFPHGGRNSLLAVYGNGEGTFLKLNKNAFNMIRIVDCEYRNWTLGDSDMIFIDLDNGEVESTLTYCVQITGSNNFLYYDPSDEHIRSGIRGSTLATYSGLKIENTIIWGAQNLTDEGDLILQSVIPQMQRSIKTGKANYWYYIGALKENQYSKDYIFEVTLGLITFKVNMIWNGNTHTTTVFNVTGDSSFVPNPGTYSFGYIYDSENGSIKFYVGSSVQFSYTNITAYVIEPTKRYYLGYKEMVFIGGTGSQEALGGAFADLTMDDSKNVVLS